MHVTQNMGGLEHPPKGTQMYGLLTLCQTKH